MQQLRFMFLQRALGALLWMVPLGGIAQTPALHWAKMAKDNNMDLSCNDIVIDPTGFVYTTGVFGGTVDFDPGAGVFNITALGASDAFIQKLDTNGNFVWAKALRGGADSEGWALGLDMAGNVFVAGYFDGTVDFDPNAGTVNIAALGFTDLFVLKLNSAGAYQWVKRSGSASCYCMPIALCVDAAGSVYTTGSFTSATDFNPGAATAMHNTVGSYDVFLQKLDASGNYVFSRSFGGTDTDAPLEMSLDASNNILISGVFTSASVDFDPGLGVFTMGAVGTQDYFVQKLNAAGNFVSAFKIGNPTTFLSGSSVFDATGNVISIGSFNATVDMDPGAGTLNFSPLAGYDGFVQKVNSANTLQWARQFSSTSIILLERVVTDPAGNVYVAGYFDGTVDLNPGPGVASYTAPSSNSVIVKLDAAGNFVWAAVGEGTDYTVIQGLALDLVQNVYACGFWYGTTDFDPQATVFTMTTPAIPVSQFVFKLRHGAGILPISSLMLTGVGLPARAELAWQVASASTTQYFEIERSVDRSHFETQGSVPASDAKQYAFTDQSVSPGEHYWYRIRQVDWDGNSVLSEAIDLTIPATGETIGFAPNPATEGITIWATEAIGELQILNALGQVVLTATGGDAQEMTVALQDLPTGFYWIHTGMGRKPMRLMIE